VVMAHAKSTEDDMAAISTTPSTTVLNLLVRS
jgi:hypothetical protein